MARSIVGVTIEAPGRDYGKTFRITERETEQTEAWLARALLALANAGVEIPAHLAAAGVSGLAHFDPTTLRGVPWSEAKPLLDEMLDCVELIDPAQPGVGNPLKPGDVEQLGTLLRLRMEVAKMHVEAEGVFTPAAATITRLTLGEPLQPRHGPIGHAQGNA